jgi:hypothetical protein
MTQFGVVSENRNVSRAVMATANPAMPIASMRDATSRGRRDPSGGASFGIHRRVAVSAMSATGTFTKNTARHPSASTRTPPTGRPSEAVAMPAICRPPRTLPGGWTSFACWARLRMSSIAVG